MPSLNSKITVRPCSPRSRTDYPAGDFFEVRRPTNRVGHSREKNIRARALDVTDGRFDVFEFLAFVAPQEEHPCLNASGFAKFDCCLDLLYGNPTLHAIKHTL